MVSAERSLGRFSQRMPCLPSDRASLILRRVDATSRFLNCSLQPTARVNAPLFSPKKTTRDMILTKKKKLGFECTFGIAHILTLLKGNDIWHTDLGVGVDATSPEKTRVPVCVGGGGSNSRPRGLTTWN